MWKPWAGSLLHAIFFYSRLSVSKSFFYVSLGNNFFTVFCGGPLVVEAPEQLPSLPPPLNPALFPGRQICRIRV